MSRIKKWTDEKILEVSKNYNTRKSFQKAQPGAYNAAYKNNILDKVCSHMKLQYINWTQEKLQIEANKYDSRKEFQIGNNNAYDSAHRKGILDEVCSHMTHSLKYWSEVKIFEEAKKFNYRNEFRINSGSAYNAARRLKILDEVCSHMKKAVNGVRETYIGRKTILYYVKINDLFKIGITIHERYKNPEDTILKYRYGQDIRHNNIKLEIIDYKTYDRGEFAYDNEQEILEMYTKDKYTGEKFTNGGESEMYTKDIYSDLRRYFK